MQHCKRLSVILKLWNVVLRVRVTSSSVGGGGGRGFIDPPIGLSTKMQNKKNTKFLALLRLFSALEWTKKQGVEPFQITVRVQVLLRLKIF